MQAISNSWALTQTQLGSLSGLASNGYEAVPQEPAAHSAVYTFVDSEDFIYDGCEWDDDAPRDGKPAASKSSRFDTWGDYAGAWERSDEGQRGSPSPKQSPKQSPKGRSGGFWGLFTKQRQQESRAEPLRHH